MENHILPEISSWKEENGIKYHQIDLNQLDVIRKFIKNHPEYYFFIKGDIILVCEKEEKLETKA